MYQFFDRRTCKELQENLFLHFLLQFCSQQFSCLHPYFSIFSKKFSKCTVLYFGLSCLFLHSILVLSNSSRFHCAILYLQMTPPSKFIQEFHCRFDITSLYKDRFIYPLTEGYFCLGISLLFIKTLHSKLCLLLLSCYFTQHLVCLFIRLEFPGIGRSLPVLLFSI